MKCRSIRKKKIAHMTDSYAMSKQCINSWENMHMKCRRISKQIAHTTKIYDSHAASSALILGLG